MSYVCFIPVCEYETGDLAAYDAHIERHGAALREGRAIAEAARAEHRLARENSARSVVGEARGETPTPAQEESP